MKPRVYKHTDELLCEYAARKSAIRKRITDFAAIRPDEYFYELVYCLLTPQSSAVNAARAVDSLKACSFKERDLDPSRLLHQKEHYIRFHNTKGRRLTEAKRRFSEISATLSNGHSGEELRTWLVANVKGLGWKEASHFLRNIGYRNLAILDRHILKNLKRHNVIGSLPKTLTPQLYHTIEERFMQFSRDVGITMDELDLLFWSHETGEILK